MYNQLRSRLSKLTDSRVIYYSSSTDYDCNALITDANLMILKEDVFVTMFAVQQIHILQKTNIITTENKS